MCRACVVKQPYKKKCSKHNNYKPPPSHISSLFGIHVIDFEHDAALTGAYVLLTPVCELYNPIRSQCD